MKKILILLFIFSGIFILSSCTFQKKDGNEVNEMQDSTEGELTMIIEENTKKIEEIVSHCYNAEKKAALFAENLSSVGVGKIVEVSVQEKDEYVIVVHIVDEHNNKYIVNLNAETGFVRLITDSNGKALFYYTN